jgi:asparagine synthase (glutamine-hydrolysing)
VGDITLGHLRLSIIDLDERSNQPMFRDGLYVVFNGEIYNFISIKAELVKLGYSFCTTSDTEVLLVGYKHWGADVLQKLNGMFAFAIYDTIKQTIFCARDRLGVKPFYYYWENGEFEICSQLRPLINSRSNLSEEAVSIFLDCGYIPSPYSVIKNVFKLPPGNYLQIDLKSKTKNVNQYWNLKPVEQQNISYEEAKNQLHDLLKDAVQIRLQSDVPLGSFLSGGIDSAVVSGIASRLSANTINTYTIAFEDPAYDESEVAQQYANIIGSNHTVRTCKPEDVLNMLPKLFEIYDEPFADSSALPSLLLNCITKDYVTVALAGDGGDESFLGYNHFDMMHAVNKYKTIFPLIRGPLQKLNLLKFFKSREGAIENILKMKKSDEFAKAIFVGLDTLQKNRNTSWVEEYYNDYKYLSKNYLQRMADLNIKLWLENDSNVKVDRASMAFSVEVRSPFLDYRIVEFARTLPVEYRYQKGRKKRILRDILKEYIPEEVFNKPKKGFSIPREKWTRGYLKNDIVKELNDDFLLKVPNLNIEKFRRQLSLHFNAQGDYSFSIWKLYILAKWYKEFKF